MRPLRRTLAGAVAVAALSLVASACDSSPYAASVNGHVIKETALNAELRARSASKAYVAGVDASSSTAGYKVEGSAPGSYSTGWTAQVLSDMVDASVLHQYLQRTHDLPNGADLAVARGLSAAAYRTTWDQFPASLRTTLTERFAEQAQVYPQYPLTAADTKSLFSQYGTSLFSRVCIRTATVTVAGSGPNGVNVAASRAKAQALVTRINAGRAADVGSVICYNAAAFESLPQSTINTVLGLRAHRAAAPQRTAYGYQVTAVASRTLLPVNAEFRRAVAVAVGSSAGEKRIVALVNAAHVKVNPAYGTWAKKGGSARRVVAPSTRLAAS